MCRDSGAMLSPLSRRQGLSANCDRPWAVQAAMSETDSDSTALIQGTLGPQKNNVVMALQGLFRDGGPQPLRTICQTYRRHTLHAPEATAGIPIEGGGQSPLNPEPETPSVI